MKKIKSFLSKRKITDSVIDAYLLFSVIVVMQAITLLIVIFK